MNRVPPLVASVAILSGLSLSACAPSADEVRARHTQGAAQATVTTQKSRPVPTAPSDADFVVAVAANKQNLPFAVRFRLDSKPQVGQPLQIDFMVTPAAAAQIRSLQFHFAADSGLLLQGDAEFVVEGAAPGISVRRELHVVPQTDGLLELEARATVDANSESLSQTYIIPLIAVPAAP